MKTVFLDIGADEGKVRFDIGASSIEDTRVDIQDAGSKLVGNPTFLNFGNNFSVAKSGTGVDVNIGQTGVDFEDNGNLVVSSASAANFSSNLNVIDDGDGTITINAKNIDVENGGSALLSDISSLNAGTDLQMVDDGDGSATLNNTYSAPSPSYFHAYEVGGGQNINGSWVEINLDTEDQNTGQYTYSTGSSQVTFDEAGTYEIHYFLSIFGSSSGARTDGSTRLQKDDGTGFSEMPGTRGNWYNRAQSNGERSSASVTIIRNVNAGDTIRLQSRTISGSDTTNVQGDGAGLTVRKIE